MDASRKFGEEFDATEAAIGEAAENGDLSIADEYRKLLDLRSALTKAQSSLTRHLEAGRRDKALDCEFTLVEPAYEKVVAKEEEILRYETRTIHDLAVKVVVCAENDFSFELLNDLITVEARRLAMAA